MLFAEEYRGDRSRYSKVEPRNRKSEWAILDLNQ